jgi:hypothetical protein
MKRFMLATAAAVALALAVPMAGAQNPNTATDPVYTQTSPPPVDSPSTVEDENMEPNAPASVAPTTAQTDPSASSTASPTQSTAQTATTTDASNQADASTATAPTPMPDQYAAQQTASTDAGNTLMSPASLQEAALEAGMDGVPMTAADVCAPRDISLGGSRLSHQTRKQLRFAADRASVCDVNQVVISAPGGRGDAVRQVLVEHGFDEADIEVQEASALGVEMRFAGVTTSSPYYASLFNPQQLASADPSAMNAAPSMSPAPSATPPGDASSAPDDTTTMTAPMEHGADDPDQATTTDEETTL